MDPRYVERYRDLYARHWWWRAREALIVNLLRSQRPPTGWGQILDVGCGGGVFFDRLSEFGEVRGVEPNPLLVSTDPEVRSRIHVGPFDASYRPGQLFGLILMLDVLEHLDDPADAVQRAMSMLEANGSILITVPALEALWTMHDDVNQHRMRYTKRTMRALAQAGGMRIDQMRYFFHWPVPVKFAQRIVEGIFNPNPAPVSVPPRLINAALFRLSRAEHAALGALRLPFGSSLLVVGGRAA